MWEPNVRNPRLRVAPRRVGGAAADEKTRARIGVFTRLEIGPVAAVRRRIGL